VLANRLSADPACRVLLLEAGGRDRNFWLKLPVGYFRTIYDQRFSRLFPTEPSPPPPAEEQPEETALLSGTNRGDYLRGTDEADHILGLRGDDKLYGRDLLDGGKGEDRMYGGRGDDTYIVDDRDDRVSEERCDGTDAVETTLTSYSLGRHVENLEYTGSRDFHGKGNDAR
jgi:choline dehydrogenase-like flavoprotein